LGHFRALRSLQASTIGLQGPGDCFHWNGSIIGWYVEPLDDDAKAMVEKRAELLKARGEKGPGGVDDKPLPTSPFPAGVMRPHAGMQAPMIVGGTLNIPGAQADQPSPDAAAPAMSAPPRRRKAG
jgi:hypothetical protein